MIKTSNEYIKELSFEIYSHHSTKYYELGRRKIYEAATPLKQLVAWISIEEKCC